MRVYKLNVNFTQGQDNKWSRVSNSIFLASGDGASSGNDSDLVYCCTGFIVFGLNMLSVSSGRPDRVPVIRGKGARTEIFR